MKKTKYLSIVLLVLVLSACSAGGSGGGGGGIYSGTETATLSWTAPTTDVNGDPLAELTGYRVYYCTSSTAQCTAYNPNNISTNLLTTITLTGYTHTGLDSGYHCYDVTAYNSGGPSPSACGTGNYCCKHIQ